MEHAGALEDILPAEAQIAEIKRQLAQYNSARAAVFRTGLVRVALVVVGLAILIALMITFSNGLGSKAGAFVLLLAGPVGVLGAWFGLNWAWQPVRDHARALRFEILPIAFGFVEKLRYRNGVSPAFVEGAKRLGLVHFTRSDTEDSLDGRHEGLTFALALTRLTTGSGKNQRTTFRGLVLHVVIDDDFPGHIVVARRNSSWLADVINAVFPGTDAVLATGMDDLDASYVIHSNNRDAAEELLANRLVPTLQLLRRMWRSADIRLALSRRECYLMLESERAFFVLPGLREDVDYERHVKPAILYLAELLSVARLISKLHRSPGE